MSFQTWIYESGGIIEYRFGSNTIPSDFSNQIDFLISGIIIGFDYDYNNGSFYMASGDANAPDWTLSDDFYQWYYSGANLSDVPAEGTVYRFGPAINVAEARSTGAKLFHLPQPHRRCCMDSKRL